MLVDLGVGLWAWPLPLDYNQDGLMDLVVVCTDKPYNGTWFFEHSGQFDPQTKLPVFKPAWNWWKPTGSELVTQWRTTPQMIDWNGDGLMDLVMSDADGYLAFFERKRGADGKLTLSAAQRVFASEGASEFDSNGKATNKESGLLRLNAGVYGRGGRRTFCIVDWDGDGKMDVMLNSAPNVNFFRGLGRDAQGRWAFRDEGPVSTHVLAGHATKPTYFAATRELLIGAEDGFIYRLEQP